MILRSLYIRTCVAKTTWCAEYGHRWCWTTSLPWTFTPHTGGHSASVQIRIRVSISTASSFSLPFHDNRKTNIHSKIERKLLPSTSGSQVCAIIMLITYWACHHITQYHPQGRGPKWSQHCSPLIAIYTRQWDANGLGQIDRVWSQVWVWSLLLFLLLSLSFKLWSFT